MNSFEFRTFHTHVADYHQGTGVHSRSKAEISIKILYSPYEPNQYKFSTVFVAAEPFLYRKLVKRWKNLRLFPAVRIPTSAIKSQTGTGHKAQIRFVARENGALHSLGIVLGLTSLSSPDMGKNLQIKQVLASHTIRGDCARGKNPRPICVPNEL